MPSLLAASRELRDKRATLIEANRKLVDKALEEKRDLTTAEQQEYDTRFDEVVNLKKQIDRTERQHELDGEIEERARNPHKNEPTEEEKRKAQDKIAEFRTKIEPRVAAVMALRSNQPIERVYQVVRGTDEVRSAFRSFLAVGNTEMTPDERRALSASTDTAGGYTVPPEQFVAELIKSIDDAVFIRQLATVFGVPEAKSLGAVSLDADPADADWTSELATGSEDSTMAFGKRELAPHPLAKRIKASNKLLRSSRLNAEALVIQRLGYKFGITQEKAYMTGSGANQPLGVFTASTSGISTGRDVSAGNTTTAIQFDGLKAAKWSLKAGYLANAMWMFHRDAMKQIDQQRDLSGGAGTGQYLWQPSNQVGKPDLLLGLPVGVSEYVPNTFTTGLYVGILGDFSYYWIADALDMTVQRLVELYAETNQTGFIGRMESDGMPVLEEAFARVKLA